MKTMIKAAVVAATLGVTLTSGIFVGVAIAEQDHMWSALNALGDAKHELQNADSDKGGHRGQAIRYIDAAMDEVHKGIDYARWHHDRWHDRY